MRLLILLVTLSLASVLTPIAAFSRPKYSIQWSPADSSQPNAKRARVMIGDQEYGLTLATSDFAETSLVKFSPPSPWRVRNRTDLVPILQKALADPDTLNEVAYLWLAKLVLPHVESLRAATTYAKLFWAPGQNRKLGFYPREVIPDDALPVPAWMSYVAEPEVLAVLKGRLGTPGWGNLPDFQPLAILATSNDPRAVDALRESFETHPNFRARYAGTIVDGTYPLSERAHRYLFREILPKLALERPDSIEVYSACHLWGVLGEAGSWRTTGFDDSTRAYGHRFVEMMLSQPDFPDYPFLVYVPKGGADEWVWGAGRAGRFFDACGAFGDREQAERLTRALVTAEKRMNEPAAREKWDTRHMSLSPGYDWIVATYSQRKQSAITLMQSRDPRLTPH